ncbi:Acyl-CoA reductase [Sphingobium faniae]|nr:Acyl-CoA reductase [Sphingobium faniae]
MLATEERPIDRLKIAHPDSFYIGGEWQPARGSRRLDVVFAGSGERIAQPPEVTTTEIDKAVATARDAFDNGPWTRMSAPERGSYLRRFAAALRERAPEIETVLTIENGTPVSAARGSGEHSASSLEYFAELAETLPFHEVRPRDGGGVGIVQRVPAGVVAAILPWNWPLGLALLNIGPALAAGCTVVFKPAPETPLHSWILAECAEAAGLPPGVFNMVPAGREVGDHLVRHPGVDVVALTGSTGAGKHIAQICGERLARVHLELGGKSPAVILDDIDPATALPHLLWTFTAQCGQMCAALTRLIVPRSRKDEWAEAIAAALQTLRVGDPFDPETVLGPLAMERQHLRVLDYIEKGKAGGARLVTGGGVPKGWERGYFVEPTLFTDVTNDMQIAREEIFGPVASLIAHDGDEDAVRIANDSDFGLNGAVFSGDSERAFRAMDRIRAGNVTHNGWAVSNKFPFGGFKQSGIGRTGGPEGIYGYTEYRTLYMDAAPEGLTKG